MRGAPDCRPAEAPGAGDFFLFYVTLRVLTSAPVDPRACKWYNCLTQDTERFETMQRIFAHIARTQTI